MQTRHDIVFFRNLQGEVYGYRNELLLRSKSIGVGRRRKDFDRKLFFQNRRGDNLLYV